MKRGSDLPRQPLQRQLPVPRLAAGVLGDGRDPGAVTLPDSPSLLLVQRRRRLGVEDRLDPRGGDVRVLPAGARRTAGADLDLAQRDREARVDPQRIVQTAQYR